MRRAHTVIASALGVALVGLASAPLLAQPDDAAGTHAARMSQRVMSPFCPGKTLYDCPSSSATEWRMDMARWLGEGESEDAIMQRLQARVPSFELTPPAPTPWLFGFAWILASLVLALGIRRLVTRRRTPGALSEEGLPNESDDEEYDARLDDALRLRRG